MTYCANYRVADAKTLFRNYNVILRARHETSSNKDFRIFSPCYKQVSVTTNINNSGPGGGGVLPYERLMGMCPWVGSHFHHWIDS